MEANWGMVKDQTRFLSQMIPRNVNLSVQVRLRYALRKMMTAIMNLLRSTHVMTWWIAQRAGFAPKRRKTTTRNWVTARDTPVGFSGFVCSVSTA